MMLTMIKHNHRSIRSPSRWNFLSQRRDRKFLSIAIHLCCLFTLSTKKKELLLRSDNVASAIYCTHRCVIQTIMVDSFWLFFLLSFALFVADYLLPDRRQKAQNMSLASMRSELISATGKSLTSLRFTSPIAVA
jgi:hypothetical protein